MRLFFVLQEELQNYTDAYYGEVYRWGTDPKIDALYERYFAVGMDFLPGEDEEEEFMAYKAITDELVHRLTFPKVTKRLNSHERIRRGLKSSRGAIF